MKVGPEDFRRYYSSLHNEELLHLERADLTDIARSCYDHEVARRGLIPVRLEPAPEADEVAASESDDASGAAEPVMVERFLYPDPAKLVRAKLRAAGIPCYLENEHTLAANWLWTNAFGGLRLMVPASCLDRAREQLEADSPREAPRMPAEAWDGVVRHRFAEVNGIRMHYAEAGSGPLVLLCHGFPELWYSWRHQLGALAAKGYRAVAPDLRGYGQTDCPSALEAYDIFQLTGDLIGLVNALDQEPAVIIGHDWGAWLASYAALLRPELFRAVVLLSVPYIPRRAVNQTGWEQRKYPGRIFYQAGLRSPLSEQYFNAGIRDRMLSGFWTLSGDIAPAQRWKPVRSPEVVPAAPPLPPGLPPWLTERDLDYYVGEYSRTGFTGGLNYYRNMDRNWALTPFLDGAQILQRTLFVAGDQDPCLDFLDNEVAEMEANIPNLSDKVLIPGAGHWIQQERPELVNRALLSFLSQVEAGVRAAAHGARG